MKEFKTVAELEASKQTVSDLMLYCRENNLYYIVQDDGYTPVGDDVTFINGRVGKAVFIADAKYIRTTNGNVQDDIDSIVSGGLPTQSGNELKFLRTDGSSAQWVNGQIEVATFTELEALEPTSDGMTFICQERDNARYILRPVVYVSQAGDVTFANSRVGELQNEEADPVKMGAVADGVTLDDVIINACIQRYGWANIKDNQYAVAQLNIDNSGQSIVGYGSGVAKINIVNNAGEAGILARDGGGVIRGMTLKGLTVTSTLATSTITSIKMDGVRNFCLDDLVIDRGNVGLHILGCSQGNIDNTTIIYENNNGGTITGRKYLLIEETANTNIGTKHPGDLFFSNFNGRCGADPFCETGIEIHSGDGIWFDNYHIGNCTSANVHINADRTARCTGLKFINGWHDLGTGNGCVIEGDTPVTIGNYHFTSVKSLGGGSGITGYDINGSADNIQIGGAGTEISGYTQRGIRIRSTFTGDVTVDGFKLFDNSLGGSFDGIVDESATCKTTIINGEASGTAHRYHINIQQPKANVIIKDVDVSENSGTTGRIRYTETVGNIVAENKGYNPTGVFSETITASPWVYENDRGHDVRFICNGGTITGISINGTLLTGKTEIDTVLSPTDEIAIAYSSTPNAFLFGM